MAKFKITLKDPDGIYEGIKEAVQLTKLDAGDVEDLVGDFTQYGDYLTVEFDTETHSAAVVKS